jgi:hypothetical protein
LVLLLAGIKVKQLAHIFFLETLERELVLYEHEQLVVPHVQNLFLFKLQELYNKLEDGLLTIDQEHIENVSGYKREISLEVPNKHSHYQHHKHLKDVDIVLIEVLVDSGEAGLHDALD